jgi:hypothetical protein
MDVLVGAVEVAMVNPFDFVTFCPPVVNTTFHVPACFSVIGSSQVILVADTLLHSSL